MTDIAFHYRPATDAEHNETVRHLRAHTEAAVGVSVQHIPFAVVGYVGDRLAASVIGKIFFQWAHLDLIWVAEDLRGFGVGKHIMKLAEDKARELNLSGIEVWTQSWQAPEFYRKQGYEELATLEDFTPGRKRHVFRKYLNEAARP